MKLFYDKIMLSMKKLVWLHFSFLIDQLTLCIFMFTIDCAETDILIALLDSAAMPTL